MTQGANSMLYAFGPLSHSRHFILSHLSCPWEEVHCRL